ncbi:MAG: ATP-grasp domain-containing protein [Phyllobacteriaceae bacterium]|nr:ATP-grasp domain-containing protein [Phyllobacteriaceae bacterium]
MSWGHTRLHGSRELFDILDDKDSFARLLAETGLPHPADHQTIDAQLPLVVKPSRGSSAKGVFYIRDEIERQAARDKLSKNAEKYIIQDYVAGQGIGFSGFFDNGVPLVSYIHSRVGEYPHSGGSSVVRERYGYADAKALEALVPRASQSAVVRICHVRTETDRQQ